MSALELKIPPVGVGIGIAALAWGVSRLDVLSFERVDAVVVGLVAAGIAVAIAGVVAFRRSKTTVDPFQPEKASALVTGGIYRFSRNPMYLGMLLVLLGWAGFVGDWVAVAVTVLFIPYMTRFQIAPEERVMTSMFGEQYEQYCKRVRRWI